MKKILLIFVAILLYNCTTIAQTDFNQLNPIKGYRLKISGNVTKVYVNINDTPELKDYRMMNSSVYFCTVGNEKKTISGVVYVLITIPGQITKGENLKVLKDANVDPRNRLPIQSEDFNYTFWVDEKDIDNSLINSEYIKFKSDAISGLLTAPFKLRVKTKAMKENYIDGSFNVGGFLGYKLSFGSNKPTYASIIGFLEMTTLEYNSTNNSEITDSKTTQTGAGYSIGLGAVFRIADISPGIIFGWDHGLGDMASSYLYHDHLWISFSLNYDFIKPKADKKAEGN